MKEATTATPDDPATMAKRAGLVYVTDEQPGYSRRGCGTGFTYLTPGGERLADGAEVQRCKDLVIPPAWQKVWICTESRRPPAGHRLRRRRAEAVPLPRGMVRSPQPREVRPDAGLC